MIFYEPGDPVDGSVERWAFIEGTDNHYVVSTFGNVMRVVAGPGTRPGTGKGRPLKPILNSRGYPTVKLSVYGKRWTEKIHRLVARAFLTDRPDQVLVHHDDENRMNCRVTNLVCKEVGEHPGGPPGGK